MSVEIVHIVDDAEQRMGHVETILAFMGFDVHVHAHSQIELSGVCNTLLVGFCEDLEKQRACVTKLSQDWPKTPVVMLNCCLDKPVMMGDELKNVIGEMALPLRHGQLVNTLHQAGVYLDSHYLKGERRPLDLFRSLVGTSHAIQQVRTMIQQVTETDASVLVLGDSGTGKEVVARNVHYHSKRRHKPFVPINCGAIPPDLLESELFGHEKGAFTGAISARKGRFEMAEGGTLFLDEIGDMSMPMQVKLLRVLQERVFERVGGNKTIKVDVRIIAATHRNLEQAISTEKFREDLFYRLNVFPICMPSLKDRQEDIPVLIEDLIKRIEHENRGSVRLTPSTVLAMCQYAWPGNVRELANMIERLAIIKPYGVAEVSDLPEKMQLQPVSAVSVDDFIPSAELPNLATPPAPASALPASKPILPNDGLDLKQHLADLECDLIRQALDDADGVVAHAARRLNMRRTTLVEKIRKYSLQRGEVVAEI